MRSAKYAQLIEEHYAQIWSTPIEAIRWEKGPIHELPPEFRVLRIRRTSDMMAYATRCMSQPDDRECLEIHALCRPSDQTATSLVEILTAVAHYHRTGRTLGLGHTVNFGKAWISGSPCAHGMLSLPYLDGPRLEWLDDPRVRFLWLIPITAAEVEFKNLHGMEALERRFEETSFDFLDPFRAPVV